MLGTKLIEILLEYLGTWNWQPCQFLQHAKEIIYHLPKLCVSYENFFNFSLQIYSNILHKNTHSLLFSSRIWQNNDLGQLKNSLISGVYILALSRARYWRIIWRQLLGKINKIVKNYRFAITIYSNILHKYTFFIICNQPCHYSPNTTKWHSDSPNIIKL